MLSQSPDVTRFDLSCLKVILSGGSLLSATIRMEAFERIPSLRYIRESYGLNECGLVTLTYPREKKNSVPGGIKVSFICNMSHMSRIHLAAPVPDETRAKETRERLNSAKTNSNFEIAAHFHNIQSEGKSAPI